MHQYQRSQDAGGRPARPGDHGEALREAVLNALVHRDYFTSASIRILVFRDRIDIVSPGALPDSLSIEDIRHGKSNRRNPTLSEHAFRLLPYRGLGSGIPRALDEWPQIELIDETSGNQFTARVQRPQAQWPGAGKQANAPLTGQATDQVAEQVTEQVSEQATEPTPDQLPSPNAAQPLHSETAAGTDVPLPAVPSAVVGQALPDIPLGALPPSSLLVYKLTGQEKGLNYYASGELRWQHNEQAYALGLSVKAFLVGSRHWRSVGDITSAGLAPRRFSDSWRSERASHFDRDKNRVVFSSNAPEATLLAGAQDQISLYVQLAAAMTGSPERFVPGTRLQIQTITLRDALPWTLTLEQTETLTVDNQPLATAKWSCQPRNRFDAKVEFWVAEKHQWLPVRIRITQASGSFIDLNLSEHQALPALAPVGNPT